MMSTNISIVKKKVGSPIKHVATNILDPSELEFKTVTVYMIPMIMRKT